jgi:hypothetical protein
MQIKKINWQRPLVERLAKFFRAPVAEIEAIMRVRSDPFTRRAAMLDALCDQQGVHLAMNTPMVERLEALQLAERLSQDVDEQPWHLPYTYLRIGTDDKSPVPPCNVMYAPARVHRAHCAEWGLRLDDATVKPDDMLLLVTIAGREDDGVGTPGCLTALLTPQEVRDTLAGKLKHSDPHPKSQMSDIETALMTRTIELVVSLGIYLSLDGVEPDVAPASVRWAPRVVRERKRLPLRLLACEPRDIRGEHLVREHVRQLRAERYYQGVWEAWPRGSRYSLVRAHLRGGE